MWAGRLNADECERVIVLHRGKVRCRAECRGATALSSETVICPGFRDGWGRRLWEVATLYNSRYGFELFGEMGQLQLTRYVKSSSTNGTWISAPVP